MDRQPRLITVEEYALMPDPGDGTLDELIAGELVYRPIPSVLHGYVSGNAGFLLGEYQRRMGGAATLRCGMVIARNPDTVISPDAAYWRVRESVIAEQGWPTIPPQAAFEIVDIEEPYSAVMRRVRLLLRFGVELMWLVDPVGKEVMEYRSSTVRSLSSGDTLDGGEVLPGFSCQVAELFA